MPNTTPEIKRYWDNKAEQLRTAPSATMKDIILRSLEIEAIASRLILDDSLLDVGCGNAFGSVLFAEKCRRVLAVDFSDKMISMAQQAISENGRGDIQAEVADVLTVGSRYPGMFSAVSSVRCLINLPEEEQQYSAIEQLGQVLRPGGRLFLAEGVAEHWEALNALRRQAGLPAMRLNWHNRLFRKVQLEETLQRFFTIQEIVDFGEYYFLSRIVHPLLTAPDEPSFDGILNQAAKTVWQKRVANGKFSEISTLVLYVCRK